MKSDIFLPVIIKPVISVTPEMLLTELRTTRETSLGRRALDTIDKMISSPSGLIMYRSCPVILVSNKTVAVDDVAFHSATLASLLSEGDIIHAHIISRGVEPLWHDKTDDPLAEFCRETVDSLILKESQRIFQDTVGPLSHHPLSFAHPGSVADWDVSELEKLFFILGMNKQGRAVTLSDAHVMSPLKTTAGIAFHSPRHFVNCMSCPRENCPHRRADYSGASVERGRQS